MNDQTTYTFPTRSWAEDCHDFLVDILKHGLEEDDDEVCRVAMEFGLKHPDVLEDIIKQGLNPTNLQVRQMLLQHTPKKYPMDFFQRIYVGEDGCVHFAKKENEYHEQE